MPRGRKSRNGKRNGSRSQARGPTRSIFTPAPIRMRSAVLCPPYTDVCLKYSDKTSLSAVIFANRIFGMNCLYDSNLSGVGVQPVGFDQWMALYFHYYVHKCQIIVDLMNLSTGNLTEAVIYPSLNGTALVSTDAAIDQPFSVVCNTSGTAGKPSARMSRTYSIPTLAGKTTTDLTWAGTPTANPSSIVYLNIAVGSSDNLTNLNVIYRVTLKYWVRFFEVRQLAES